MKKISSALLRLSAVLLLLTPFAARSLPNPSTTFLFDFGGANTTTNGAAPDDPLYYWNNIGSAVGFSDTGSLLNLVTSENNPSSVSLFMIQRFNGNNENGTQASTLFPSDATRDSLFGNTESFNGLANIFPSFKLTGLDPGLSYDFTFYASRMNVSDNRETGYTLTGANNGFAALNAANNIDNFVAATGIFPTAGGEITVSLAPTANNNNSLHFTYLGVMKVETVIVPEPSAVALLVAGGLLLVCSGRRKRLS